MKLLVVGDSHCGPIYRGLRMLQEAGERHPDLTIRPMGGGHLLPTPFFRDAGTHAEITEPLYARQFSRLPPLQPAGIGAMALSMPLWPMRAISRLIWSGQALAGHHGTRQPVSHAVFRELVLADQRYVLQLIEVLRRIGLPVAAVSGPGLFRDHALLKHHPPEDVLAMFEIFRAVMKGELTARDIDIIDIPPDCLDGEGFMYQKYRHPDPADHHHANGAYGKRVVRQLLAWKAGLTARV